MQVIIITRSSGASIYHERDDIIGALGTLNEWMHEQSKRDPGERERVSVRFTTISREFWDALPEIDS